MQFFPPQTLAIFDLFILIHSTLVNQIPFNRTPRHRTQIVTKMKFLDCNVLCFSSIIGQPRYPTMTEKFYEQKCKMYENILRNWT